MILDDISTIRNRISEDQPLGVVTYSLADKMKLIQKNYPTILDVLGNLGGTIQVIAFFIAVWMGFYHGIGHEQALLNEALLQKSENEITQDFKSRRSSTMFGGS